MSNPPHHDSPPNPATSARHRKPVQDRSLRSVKRILDAASALLSRMPLDDVTTTHIAAEAGLSVGGLYRFFPDRETIVDAIAGGHILQLGRTVDRDILRPRLQPLQQPENFVSPPCSIASSMPTSPISTPMPTSAPSPSDATSVPPSLQERQPAPASCPPHRLDG